MLWAALRFPDLSLQLRLRGGDVRAPVVVQDTGNRPHVVSCNQAAADLGVQAGMAVSAAYALAPELDLCTRDPAREAKALEGIALWAGQLTPTISLASTDEILIEIGGCERLFGGLQRINRRLRSGLEELGYRAVVSTAPTPTGALWLSRAGIATSVGDRHTLRRALAPLRLACLGQPEETVAALAGTGVHTLADYLRLPRDGLARRFGQRLLDETDRALGHLPDPRLPFVAPLRYAATLELPAPVQETEPLLFAAKRLMLELAGYLAMRQIGVTRLHLDLGHRGRASTRVALGLSAPNRDAAHLMAMLREKLATVALPEAAEAITLVAGETRPLVSRSRSLLPDDRSDPQESWRVIEHLRARLGSDAVYGLEAVPDHRPELALRKTAAGRARDGNCDLRRPLWLLPQPRPLAAGAPLTLLDGPERIESGWWDDRDVTRDYFVACDESGAKLWVFRQRDRQPDRRPDRPGDWFLHGLFA